MPRAALFRIASAVLCICALGRPAAAQVPVPVVRANERTEFTFLSPVSYADPHNDVRIRCAFTGPGGAHETIDAFWDGGRTYRVRFSPWIAGDWCYRTACSDTTNSGLHTRTGCFRVVTNDDPDIFHHHGWLHCAIDGTHFEHADGTPFFYLADVAWEIGWKSRMSEVFPYFSDRRSKGFNALQITPTSHQMLGPLGVINQSGIASFPDQNFMHPNPAYFIHVDSIMTAAADSGFLIAMAPLWAAHTDVNQGTNDYFLTLPEALSWARYVAARYAGDNVVWIVAGDNVYDTPERKAFWDAFARMLKDAGGPRHLTTIHTAGTSASWMYFDPATDWLDFQMYQAGHWRTTEAQRNFAREGSALVPRKPVVDGETTFEDLPMDYSSLPDTLEIKPERIDADLVRRASYESVLGGARIGIAYGGNGVWQWNTPALGGNLLPRYYVWDAWKLPGSAQMTVFKRILSSVPWYSLEPVIVSDFPQRIEWTAAANDTLALVYVPKDVRYVLLPSDLLARLPWGVWIHPLTGNGGLVEFLPEKLEVQPPSPSDWILELGARPEIVSNIVSAPLDFALPVDAFVPSADGAEAIRLTVRTPVPGDAEVGVWDLFGRERGHVACHVPLEAPYVRLGSFPSGAFVYMLRFFGEDGRYAVRTGRFISLGGR